jgi:hypothetical protein
MIPRISINLKKKKLFIQLRLEGKGREGIRILLGTLLRKMRKIIGLIWLKHFMNWIIRKSLWLGKAQLL